MPWNRNLLLKEKESRQLKPLAPTPPPLMKAVVATRSCIAQALPPIPPRIPIKESWKPYPQPLLPLMHSMRPSLETPTVVPSPQQQKFGSKEEPRQAPPNKGQAGSGCPTVWVPQGTIQWSHLRPQKVVAKTHLRNLSYQETLVDRACKLVPRVGSVQGPWTLDNFNARRELQGIAAKLGPNVPLIPLEVILRGPNGCGPAVQEMRSLQRAASRKKRGTASRVRPKRIAPLLTRAMSLQGHPLPTNAAFTLGIVSHLWEANSANSCPYSLPEQQPRRSSPQPSLSLEMASTTEISAPFVESDGGIVTPPATAEASTNELASLPPPSFPTLATTTKPPSTTNKPSIHLSMPGPPETSPPKTLKGQKGRVKRPWEPGNLKRSPCKNQATQTDPEDDYPLLEGAVATKRCCPAPAALPYQGNTNVAHEWGAGGRVGPENTSTPLPLPPAEGTPKMWSGYWIDPHNTLRSFNGLLPPLAQLSTLEGPMWAPQIERVFCLSLRTHCQYQQTVSVVIPPMGLMQHSRRTLQPAPHVRWQIKESPSLWANPRLSGDLYWYPPQERKMDAQTPPMQPLIRGHFLEDFSTTSSPDRLRSPADQTLGVQAVPRRVWGYLDSNPTLWTAPTTPITRPEELRPLTIHPLPEEPGISTPLIRSILEVPSFQVDPLPTTETPQGNGINPGNPRAATPSPTMELPPSPIEIGTNIAMLTGTPLGMALPRDCCLGASIMEKPVAQTLPSLSPPSHLEWEPGGPTPWENSDLEEVWSKPMEMEME